MKQFLILAFVLIGIEAFGQPASIQDPAAAAAWRQRYGPPSVADIEELVSKVNNPYKEFEGKPFYIGKKWYADYGYIPKDPAYKFAFITRKFKVLDVTSEGCRIERTRDSEDYTSDHDFFVHGMRGFHSGRIYGAILIFRTGESFSYTTTTGGSRSIPLFEWGNEMSKEEYLKMVTTQTKNLLTNSPTATNKLTQSKK